jgi:2-C-methyl-D-erythritol 2,4-cyclodiphosphate synthase
MSSCFSPQDLDAIRQIVREETRFRTGLGFDVHQFRAGRRLVLGGVEIACDVGLLGHSDADVITHAAMEACLGAAGLPDIGHFFPDTSAEFKDADSLQLARRVKQKLDQEGYELLNLDLMVLAEKPRLAPHREKMRQNLAQAFGLEIDQVTVKATTMEKLGSLGRGEGIATLACALLRKV